MDWSGLEWSGVEWSGVEKKRKRQDGDRRDERWDRLEFELLSIGEYKARK